MKHILCSTAIALFVAAPLSAQQTTAPDAAMPEATAPGGATTPPAADAATMFLPGEQPGDIFASDLIGMSVYASDTDYSALSADMPIVAADMEGWDDIGDVNDVLISEAGDIRAVLVDVGGFLGMGARTVALDMAQVHLLTDDAGSRFAAVTSTREQLEAAPEFVGESMVTAAAPATPPIAAPGVTPDPMTSATARPALVREGFTDIDYATITADQIEGANVYDASDNDIGAIGDIILDANGAVQGAVVDVGGFLGMGVHPVLVSFDEMQIMRHDDGNEIRVFIDDTREELEQRPEYVEG